jgi:hypothetical protein
MSFSYKLISITFDRRILERPCELRSHFFPDPETRQIGGLMLLDDCVYRKTLSGTRQTGQPAVPR